MRPILFALWGYSAHAYREMLTLAFVVCTLLAVRASARRDDGFIIPPSVGVFAFLGALFGAKFFYILQYERPSDLWRAVLLWEGGLVFYGGLVGGLIAVCALFRARRVPIMKGLDVIAPYLALGEAIARIGCFFNGCCWGRVSAMPWAVRFPKDSMPYSDQLVRRLIPPDAACSLPVHPTQLYLTGMLFMAFLILRVALRRKRNDGAVVTSYLALYGVMRFIAEAFRDDSARPLLGMSVSQIISVVLFASGLWWLMQLRRRDEGAEISVAD